MIQIKEFKQSKIIGKYGFDVQLKGGICFGLSYIWCRSLVADRQSVANVEDQLFDGNLSNSTKAMTIQRSYQMRSQGERARNGGSDTAGFIDLLAKGDKMSAQHHYGANEISRQAGLLRGRMALVIGFTINNNDGTSSGHAVAVGNDDGLNFFDPNFGRYYADRGRDILPWLRQKYQGIDVNSLRVSVLKSA